MWLIFEIKEKECQERNLIITMGYDTDYNIKANSNAVITKKSAPVGATLEPK